MDSVTLSPKYQGVISLGVCQQPGLTPGEKMQVIPCASRAKLIPARKTKSLRGFLKGMEARVEREAERA